MQRTPQETLFNTKFWNRYLLARFFVVFHGFDKWISKGNWVTNADECSWFGIQCERTLTSITGIQLGQNNLLGTWDEEMNSLFMFLLPHLTEFELQGNRRFQSSTMIPMLPSLEKLNISNCGFKTNIQSIFGSMPNLRHLDISNNDIRGSIPTASSRSLSSQLPNLQILNLRDNPRLEGDLHALLSSTSNGVGGWSQLESLDVSKTKIGGTLPINIGDTLTNLTTLVCSESRLQGKIPTEIGKLTMLGSLQLSMNYALTGTLPSTLHLMAALTLLDLSWNKFTGTIPWEYLSALSNLTSLQLNGNEFTGSVSTDIGKMTKLEYIELGENSGLMGTLPETYLLQIPKLQLLDISRTNMTGEISDKLLNHVGRIQYPCSMTCSSCDEPCTI